MDVYDINTVDHYLDFDFGSFDLNHFDGDMTVELSTKQPSETSVTLCKGVKNEVKKSKRTYIKRKSPFKRGMSVSEALAGGAMPNMSRRPPSSVLVAFPHYDKCDSLIYFPHAMSRHMNSGDMDAFSKLVVTHLDKNCDINMYFGGTDKLSAKSLIPYIDIANDIEPDRIMCVHSTKVVDNQIRSTIYQKQTDSQQLFNFMSHTLRDSNMDFSSMIYRSQRFELYDKDLSLTPCAVQELMFHASLEEDLLVYLQCELVLTVDDITKKIVAMNMVGRLTSAHPVPVPTSSMEDASVDT